MISRNLLRRLRRNNMKKEALAFYVDNGLDEIISEKSQNHFLVVDNKKSVVKTSSKIQDQNRTSAVNPAISTSQALSTLAKKSQQNSQIASGVGGASSAGAAAYAASGGQEQKFIPLNEIVAAAKKAAQAANTIAELRKAVEKFDGCGLKKMATNTVFADGNPDAEIMVIGEAPGNNEDLQGIPFCGDSGKLLDDMFRAINLDRTKLYITNVIFWRPPGNRRPTEEELAICRPFVERHIQLFNPKIMILVGSTAMSAGLGINDPVTGVRGKIIDFAANFMPKKIKTFVVFHPSYLMRQSGKKRLAWRDMLVIEKFLQQGK